MFEYIESITWQAWAFIGILCVFTPYAVWVATGHGTKARSIAPKK